METLHCVCKCGCKHLKLNSIEGLDKTLDSITYAKVALTCRNCGAKIDIYVDEYVNTGTTIECDMDMHFEKDEEEV